MRRCRARPLYKHWVVAAAIADVDRPSPTAAAGSETAAWTWTTMVAVSLRSPFRILLLAATAFACFSLLSFLRDTPPVEIFYPPQSTHALLAPVEGVVEEPVPAPGHSPRYAVATFLTHDDHQDWDESHVQNDFAFIGVRLLTYQLLFANETRIRDPSIDFFVLTTSTVSPAKRQQLLLDGATLVDVNPPPLPAWLWKGDEKFAQIYATDHLAKLKLFGLAQYDRILFLNPDNFLTRPIDGIFTDHSLRTPATTLSEVRPDQIRMDKNLLPSTYIFAGRTDTAWAKPSDPYNHNFPPARGDLFRMSAVIFAPSRQLYELLIHTLHSSAGQAVLHYFRREKWKNRWMRNAGPEHAILNHVFRR
ncbi:MAG: hypothetical protein INR71_11915, partial [Terriglobus roseus]|nr:hypothetical protein [Terriglobus roseus]